MSCPFRRWLLLASCAAGLASAPARADEERGSRGVAAAPLASAPLIDCRIDEAAWAGAAPLGGFHQTHPGDNAPPSRATDVRVGYTPRALYFAIRAEDDPARVRATLARRDALADDDRIALYLDTFADRRRAYVLVVNPLGVQQDGIVRETGETDLSFDLVFESRGCLTAHGYAIEIEVPFESLRYQAGPGRTWGLHVIREIRHRDEEDSWMPLRRDRVATGATSARDSRARLLAQAGALSGLHGLEAPILVEAIPVTTLARTDARLPAPGPDGETFDARDRGEIGLTAKVALTPSVGFHLAVNPDFAEVEADEPQVTANQRFPLFFAEKRPFFLEGSEMFRTPLQAFHSRTVVDPVVALKGTGTFGRTSASLLLGADAAPGHVGGEEEAAGSIEAGRRASVAALRIRRDVGEQSAVGLLATSYDFVDRRNHVAGFDARLSLGPRTAWNVQALGSLSRLDYRDPETGAPERRDGRGFAYWSELARNGPRTSVQLVGEGYSPDHRAALGYTQRADTNRWSLFTRYNAPPRAQGTFVSWSALFTAFTQFDWKGRMQYAYLYPRVSLAFARQTYLTVFVYRDYLRVFEEEFGPSRGPGRPGAFLGAPERSTTFRGVTVEATTAPTGAVSLRLLHDRTWDTLDYDLGAGHRYPRVSPAALLDPAAPLDPGPGRSHTTTGSVTVQPSEALRLTGSYEWTRLTRDDTRRVAFDQRLLSLRAQYAFTPFTSLRARLDRDSLDGRTLGQLVFGWAPRPGTALHVGYDETGSWDGHDPISGAPVPGYRREGRTAFVKLSWAVRRRLGGSDPSSRASRDTARRRNRG